MFVEYGALTIQRAPVQEQSDDEELQGDSDAQPSSALGEGFDDLAALLDDESEPVQDGHLAVAAESAHEPAGASVDAAGAGTHEAEEAADAVHEDDDGIAPLPSTPTMKKPDRSKRRYSVALKRDAELEDFLQEIEQEEDLEEAEGDTGSVRVSVPPGLSSGEVLYVGTPDGREIVVEVPAGCGAGDDIVVDVGEGAMTVEAWEAQMAAAEESAEQTILTESEADLEVQIGEALYLVDLASDLVFQIHPVEKEVGLWDAESRRIVFDEPV